MKKCRIGIISDTHGLLRQEVLEVLEMCDYIIHGGDINKAEVLEELKRIAPVYVVRGNNDKAQWAEELPEELYFEIADMKFYMVHNKKSIPQNLSQADVVIFGHSHKYFCEEKDGVLWLNPGSCGKRRFDQQITMAVMEIHDGRYMVEKIELDQEQQEA